MNIACRCMQPFAAGFLLSLTQGGDNMAFRQQPAGPWRPGAAERGVVRRGHCRVVVVTLACPENNGINLQGFGGLELQREAWSAADAAAFADLARADGFYRVRLLLPRAREHVLASLRARCLAASGFQVRPMGIEELESRHCSSPPTRWV